MANKLNEKVRNQAMKIAENKDIRRAITIDIGKWRHNRNKKIKMVRTYTKDSS